MNKGLDEEKQKSDYIRQLKWERDMAIRQLKNDYGVGLCEKKNPNLAEVVRCKDCMNRSDEYVFKNYYTCKAFGICGNYTLPVKDEDFCRWGIKTYRFDSKDKWDWIMDK